MSQLTISSNLAALSAQRRLGQSTSALEKSFSRLSSGLRINRAVDDAAGLSISEALNVDAKVYSQGIRNINDGISLLGIAEGALEELSSITTRQIELAEQASNGTLSLAQRRAINSEANALASEYNRIVQSTSFNHRTLMDIEQSSSFSIQAGYSSANNLVLELGDELSRAVGTGSFAALATVSTGLTGRDVITADFNGDGKLDFATASSNYDGYVYLGNGDGTFLGPKRFATGFNLPSTHTGILARDFNNDGFLDLANTNYNDQSIGVHFGNGDGTFKKCLFKEICG